MNYRVAEYIPRRRDKFLNLTVDSISLPPIPAITEAVRAAAWETEGRYIRNCECEALGFGFFRESVARAVTEKGALKIDPGWVRVNNGSRTDFLTLFGILPRDLRIAVPLPQRAENLRAVTEYFDNVTFFEPKNITTVPNPDDLSMPFPEAVLLCSPCEVSGAAFEGSELCEWVDFARKNGILIIWDSTNNEYCRDKFRKSVFCAERAETCAVELYSFSSPISAGISCGYSVIPNSVRLRDKVLAEIYEENNRCRVLYTFQRAAAAALSGEGRRMCTERAELFRHNALRLSAALSGIGFDCARSGTSPYVLAAAPSDMHFERDAELCRYIEYRTGIRTTAGSELGIRSGNYLYFSGVNYTYNIDEAVDRLMDL